MVREKSQDSEEGYDFSCPTAVDVTLLWAEPVFQIGAAVSKQTGGLESISQGRDSQPVPESAVAAAQAARRSYR